VTKSVDGFEMTFAANHLGHFLLTLLLLDKLKAGAPSRIVNVSSKAHYRATTINYEVLKQPTSSTTGLPEYAVSKLCNVLFAQELARRLEGTGVTTYSLHPGAVATDVWRSIPNPFRWLIKQFFLSEEDGAKTSIMCASDPKLQNETGKYYDWNGKEVPASKYATPELAQQLWEKCEEWTQFKVQIAT